MMLQAGKVYKFPSGIRVVLEQIGANVKVAQPFVDHDKDGTCVLMNADGSVFAYPGISFLESSSVLTAYSLTSKRKFVNDRSFTYVSASVLRAPVKRRRKKK